MILFSGLAFLHSTFGFRTMRELFGTLRTYPSLPALQNTDVFVHVDSGDGYAVFDRCLRTPAAMCIGIATSTNQYTVAQKTARVLQTWYPEYSRRIEFKLVYSLSDLERALPKTTTVVYYRSDTLTRADNLNVERAVHVVSPNIRLVDGKK